MASHQGGSEMVTCKVKVLPQEPSDVRVCKVKVLPQELNEMVTCKGKIEHDWGGVDKNKFKNPYAAKRTRKQGVCPPPPHMR